MRLVRVLGVAVVVLAAACGGDDGEPTADRPSAVVGDTPTTTAATGATSTTFAADLASLTCPSVEEVRAAMTAMPADRDLTLKATQTPYQDGMKYQCEYGSAVSLRGSFYDGPTYAGAEWSGTVATGSPWDLAGDQSRIQFASTGETGSAGVLRGNSVFFLRMNTNVPKTPDAAFETDLRSLFALLESKISA